jgi:hypothetical protein
MDQFIAEFCARAEYRDLNARELWPHFHAELEKHDLGPTKKRFRDFAGFIGRFRAPKCL